MQASETETQELVVPVIREDWQVSKELLETGSVRITKTQGEREEVVRDQLLVETVDVERVPVNRVVTEVPPVRVENGVTVISVVKEFPVVVKELRVVEEVRVTQRVGGAPFEQPITLRDETVTVERGPVSAGGGEGLEFRERAERAVVSKEARVIEEVRVSRDVTERTETIRETLRSTQVEVDSLLPEKP